MKDQWGREIDYMRVSITDRCNLRCCYCMPHGIPWAPMADILTLEEYAQIVSCGAALGIRKVKVTGGEPLVRLGCCDFVAMLKQIPGIEQVTITTNGVLLGRYLEGLLAAGVDGVNISLDTLDAGLYRALTGAGELEQVLNAIKEAVKSCKGRKVPVKVNAVSLNLSEVAKQLGYAYHGPGWPELLELAKGYPVDVRFIETMPIGYGEQYPPVGHQEMLSYLKRQYPGMERDEGFHGHGPATYYRIPGFQGSIGFISALHGKFCHNCNRVRLTSKGFLKSCLCYEDGVDLRKILRGSETGQRKQDQLMEGMRQKIWGKPAAHCFEYPEHVTEYENMAKIGG